MEEKNITEQESLAIIQSMIDKSKQQLVDRSKYFFMWGFAVFGCALIQYFILKSNPDAKNTEMVWLLMPVLAVIHIIMNFSDRKKTKVLSYNTNAIGSLWLALGISFVVLTIVASKNKIDMLPFLILFYGIGNFVSGRILQFNPSIYGGISCFILSILVTYVNGPETLLILALSVLLAYIIPAFILKKEFKNQQKK